MSRQNCPQVGPLVGIWWDDGQTLAAIARPATENALTAGGFIDSDLEHWREWKHVATHFGRSPEDEYFSVPRGRVLMRSRSGQGVIYHGSATTPSRLKVIAAEFHLSDWKAGLDPHYEMDDAADELFDDW